jgi:hypothetical protein
MQVTDVPPFAHRGLAPANHRTTRRMLATSSCFLLSIGAVAITAAAVPTGTRDTAPATPFTEGLHTRPEPAIEDYGNPSGAQIVFVTALGSSDAAALQVANDAALVARFRIIFLRVASRLPGKKGLHADRSARPGRFARDIDSAVRGLRLHRPVIVDLSSDGAVATDLLAHFGSTEIAGFVTRRAALTSASGTSSSQTTDADAGVPRKVLPDSADHAAIARELLAFTEATQQRHLPLPDANDSAIAAVRNYLHAHNAHDVAQATASYHAGGSFVLSEGRGIVRGTVGIEGLQRLDAALGSWLSPIALRSRSDGTDKVVSYSLVLEQSDIARAIGVPLIVARGLDKGFVIRDGKIVKTIQPRFAAPCSAVMLGGFRGFLAWLDANNDPRRAALLEPDGRWIFTAKTAPLWIEGIRDWRSTTGWQPDAELTLACARS